MAGGTVGFVELDLQLEGELIYAFHSQGRQTSLPPLRDMLPCGSSSSTALLSHEGSYGASKGGELEDWGRHPYLQLRGI